VTTDFERVDAQQIGAQQTTAGFFNGQPYSLNHRFRNARYRDMALVQDWKRLG
jgi:hypothetical protein